jgi:hypothetical protein
MLGVALRHRAKFLTPGARLGARRRVLSQLLYSPAMRRDLERLFSALDRAAVRTVVVGGLAVNLRGHLRMTIDVDLITDLSDDAARRTVEALTSLGYRPSVPVEPAAFADPAIRKGWLENRQIVVLSWFDPAEPLSVVDLFTESPLDFEELWSDAGPVEAAWSSIRVASVRDLIRMKRASGRERDLEDVRALESIAREGGA